MLRPRPMAAGLDKPAPDEPAWPTRLGETCARAVGRRRLRLGPDRPPHRRRRRQLSSEASSSAPASSSPWSSWPWSSPGPRAGAFASSSAPSLPGRPSSAWLCGSALAPAPGGPRLGAQGHHASSRARGAAPSACWPWWSPSPPPCSRSGWWTSAGSWWLEGSSPGFPPRSAPRWACSPCSRWRRRSVNGTAARARRRAGRDPRRGDRAGGDRAGRLGRARRLAERLARTPGSRSPAWSSGRRAAARDLPLLGRAFKAGGGLSATLLGALERWTDRDSDGVGAHFGGADCDEGDPARHPGARRSPGTASIKTATAPTLPGRPRISR